jgi:acetyl esterase
VKPGGETGALLQALRGGDRAELHQQVANLLATLAASGARPLHELGVEGARTQSLRGNALVGAGEPVDEVGALELPTRAGSVRARRYAHGRVEGTVVYLHGGGFVMGDLDKYDSLCRRLARGTGCQVISVEYRLAPEHRFPAPIQDCDDALRYVAGTLHDGGPLVVMGDSAGGTAAAVATRHARDAGLEVDLQVLIYPGTLPGGATPAAIEHAASGYLRAAASAWMRELYLGETEPTHPDAAPALAPDLERLAPALLVVAEYDPLRDDALVYALALARAGVAVGVDFHPDMTHGFFHMVGFYERSPEAIDRVSAAVRALVAGDDPLAGIISVHDGTGGASDVAHTAASAA